MPLRQDRFRDGFGGTGAGRVGTGVIRLLMAEGQLAWHDFRFGLGAGCGCTVIGSS